MNGFAVGYGNDGTVKVGSVYLDAELTEKRKGFTVRMPVVVVCFAGNNGCVG